MCPNTSKNVCPRRQNGYRCVQNPSIVQRRSSHTHRLDRRTQLAACVEELELLKVDPEVVVKQVRVLAQQPRVRHRLRRREAPFWVHRQQPADQVLRRGEGGRNQPFDVPQRLLLVLFSICANPRLTHENRR